MTKILCVPPGVIGKDYLWDPIRGVYVDMAGNLIPLTYEQIRYLNARPHTVNDHGTIGIIHQGS